MIYVVVEEMIPEIDHSKKMGAASQAFLFGFVLMMILDSVLA